MFCVNGGGDYSGCSVLMGGGTTLDVLMGEVATVLDM